MLKANNLAKNLFLSVCIFLVATVLSILFQMLDVAEHIPTIFVFAVFLISLLTEGYFFGVGSAIFGMLAVNYAFTYPYLAFDFNIPVKVLFVEDDANIRSIVSTLLEMEGYQVIWASTCQLAQGLFASHQPDVIILDLGLPDMDGMRFLE